MRKNKAMIFWFSLPAVLSLLIMFVYPVCRTVLMSFFQVESVTATMADWSFYGLGNYLKIFKSASFLTSMSNMLIIWFVGGIITLALAMLMAVTVTSGIRGKKFFRAVIYLPNIISAVALATMWIQYIFNYDYGLLNEIVKLFGGDKIKWLGTDLKFWAMTGSFIFGSVGYYMLIYNQRHRRHPPGSLRGRHHRRGRQGGPVHPDHPAPAQGRHQNLHHLLEHQYHHLLPVDQDVLPHRYGIVHHCACHLSVRHGVRREGHHPAGRRSGRRSGRGADADYHRRVPGHGEALQGQRSGILREGDRS